MGPSANDFSNRRRPGRRGDGGPGMGPGRGSPRGPGGGPRESARGRTGRGLSDPRRPAASTFRRLGPRADGPGAAEGRRWSRDRDERPSAGGGEGNWRGEGGRRAEDSGPRRAPTDDRPRWRMARRPEGPPARPIRPVRPVRGDGPPPDSEPPRGDAHAGAAPNELIWGRHAALAALESERPIHRIWCTPEMRFRPGFLQLLREAKASGVLVEEVTWARLGQISGGAVHQGIVLQPAAADTLDLASLIDGCRELGESPLLVAVDGLTDPQNLGAILRSAEALGVHGLVLPQRRNAGLTGSVAKVAAGALEHLPVARVVNLNRSLETLRQEGYRVVGLDPQGSVSLEEADLEGPLVVITGSEGQGLSVLTRRSCDQLVRIPLRGSTPSLNASVATALVLYEVARRGWMRGLRGMAKPPRLVRPNVPTEAPPVTPPAEPSTPGAEARGAALPEPQRPEDAQLVITPPEPATVVAEAQGSLSPKPEWPVEAELETTPPEPATVVAEVPVAPAAGFATPETVAPPEPQRTDEAPGPSPETPIEPGSVAVSERAAEAPTAPEDEPPVAEPTPSGPVAGASEAPMAVPAPASFASDIHL